MNFKCPVCLGVKFNKSSVGGIYRCLYCDHNGEVETNKDGCYLLPDGACVSPIECVHLPKEKLK